MQEQPSLEDPTSIYPSTLVTLPQPQPPETEEEPPKCSICLNPLWFTVQDPTIPIADERLVFFPSVCTRPHGLHLMCARSHAKTIRMNRKTALGCPSCRTLYNREDEERLLPPEKKVVAEVFVRPVDADSIFDVIVWERYDPSVLFPRNPACRHTRVEQIFTQRIPCSDLPLAADPIAPPPAEIPLLETPPLLLLQRRPLREEIPPETPPPPPPIPPRATPRARTFPSALQQTLEGRDHMSRALNCMSEGVQRLRLMNRVRRRLDVDGSPAAPPSILQRVTRSSTFEARRHSQNDRLLQRMGEKLRQVQQCLNSLGRDVEQFAFQQQRDAIA